MASPPPTTAPPASDPRTFWPGLRDLPAVQVWRLKVAKAVGPRASGACESEGLRGAGGGKPQGFDADRDLSAAAWSREGTSPLLARGSPGGCTLLGGAASWGTILGWDKVHVCVPWGDSGCEDTNGGALMPKSPSVPGDG